MSNLIETIKFDIPAPRPPEMQGKLPYNEKKWFKKPWILIVIILLLAGTSCATLYGIKYILQNSKQESADADADADANATNTVQTIETFESNAMFVDPANPIEVVSLVKGKITQINFEINDLVYYNQVLIHIDNLIIKAPVVGRVTAKYVKLGDEIIPGQKIAEISQTYQSE